MTTKATRLEDAVERVRQGMKAMLRYGSSWHDVASQVGAITQLGLDSAALHARAPMTRTPKRSRTKVTWTASCAMPSSRDSTR